MTATIGETATLAHGYTMAEVDRFTRAAISKAWGAGALDYEDRWDEAWHAVVERLYDRELPRPSELDLIHAAGKALTLARNNQFRHHGINVNTGEPAPNFSRFWNGSTPTHDGFTEQLIERMALGQVLGLLTGAQYDAIAALSIYSNHRDAASALGIEVSTFSSRIETARTKIKQAWFAPETPQARRPRRGAMDACTAGHPRAEFGRIDTRGKWQCSRCNRNRARLQRARAGGYKGTSYLDGIDT